MIKETFNDKDYIEEIQKVNNDIMVKQIELNENKIDTDDSERCSNFCKYFISNIADLWRNADLDLKQWFQKLIFPEKLLYKKGRFGTTKIALIFKAFDGKSSPYYCQAPLSQNFSYFSRPVLSLNFLINLSILLVCLWMPSQ